MADALYSVSIASGFLLLLKFFMDCIIFFCKLSNEPWNPNLPIWTFFSIFECNDDDDADDDEKFKIIDWLLRGDIL